MKYTYRLYNFLLAILIILSIIPTVNSIVPIISGNNEKVDKEDQSIETLQELRKQYGASSEEYKAALSKIDMGSKNK